MNKRQVAVYSGNESAYIKVTDSSEESFGIYVPLRGNPANVAAVLEPVCKGDSVFKAGLVMADICSILHPKLRCQLTSKPSTASYVYNVYSQTIEVRNRVEQVFNGTLANFYGWAKRQTGLEDIIHKVASFVYDGGSDPGGKRTIRVEKVVREAGGRIYVEGIDLGKPDLKAAYRRYDANLIKGDIEVLN